MVDSIGQEVSQGDLCILPWKSNKMTLGVYSHETATKYIFVFNLNGEKVLQQMNCKIGVYRSLVDKRIGHFVKIQKEEMHKYIK